MGDPEDKTGEKESGEAYVHAIEGGDFHGFSDGAEALEGVVFGDEAHEHLGPSPSPQEAPTQPVIPVGLKSEPGRVYRLESNYTPGMPLKAMRAKYQRSHRDGAEPRLVIIHTAESHELPNAATNTGTWFQNTPKQLSSHYGVDADGVVQYANESATTWHTGGKLGGGKGPPWTNDESIGLELAGTAHQTAEQWADDYSAAVLANAAALTAELCRRYVIPIKYVNADALKRGERGITGHVQANEAAGITGQHWDPGPGFPWADFIAMVKHFADTQGPAGPARNPFPTLDPTPTPAAPLVKRTAAEIMKDRLAELEAEERRARAGANAPSLLKLVGTGVIVAGGIYLGSLAYDAWMASRARAEKEREQERTVRLKVLERSVPARDESQDDFVPWYASGPSAPSY